MKSGNGSDLFLETLIDEGVYCMFGNPGTTELPLMDALVNESRLDYILCLQESVTIGAAEGYAYATGGVGVVNLHVAPPRRNAILLHIKRAGTVELLRSAGATRAAGQLSEPVLWTDVARVAEPLQTTGVSYECRRGKDSSLEQSAGGRINRAYPAHGPGFLSLPGGTSVDAPRREAQGRPTRRRARFPALRIHRTRGAECSPKPKPLHRHRLRASPLWRGGRSHPAGERIGAKVFSDTARIPSRSHHPS